MKCFFGAGDRGRTGTVSLPLDFESSTSANSITPAYFITTKVIIPHISSLVKTFFQKIQIFYIFCITSPLFVQNHYATKIEKRGKKNVTQRTPLYRGLPRSLSADQVPMQRQRKQRYRSRAEKSYFHRCPEAGRKLQPFLRTFE